MKVLSRLAIGVLIGSFAISPFATRAVAQKSGFDKTADESFVEPGTDKDGRPEQSPAAPAPADPHMGWHFTVAPYLWFAGMHGTVGARGYDASVHASFGDVFSYLNIGLMVAAEPRYKKLEPPSISCG